MKAIILSPEQAMKHAKNIGTHGLGYTPWDTVLIPSTIDSVHTASGPAETISAAQAINNAGLRSVVGINHIMYTGSPGGGWFDVRTWSACVDRLQMLGNPTSIFIDYEAWGPWAGSYQGAINREKIAFAMRPLLDYLEFFCNSLFVTPANHRVYAIDKIFAETLDNKAVYWLDQQTYYDINKTRALLCGYKNYIPGIASSNIGGDIWKFFDDVFIYHEHTADEPVWSLGTPDASTWWTL